LEGEGEGEGEVARAVLGPAEKTFLKWLYSGLSGCWFASNVAVGAGKIGLPVIGRDLEIDLLESALDGLSKLGYPSVALFPWVSGEADLVAIVAALQARPRWECHIVEGLPIPRPCTAVSISYETISGEKSSAMGFAPLLSMPITRRAPIAGVGAWAGGYDNAFIKVRDGLSFLHMPQTGMRATFKKRRTLSENWTRERIGDASEPSSLYYDVAFCLSPDVRPMLEDRGVSAHASTPASGKPT
jgi:hypothetical protein